MNVGRIKKSPLAFEEILSGGPRVKLLKNTEDAAEGISGVFMTTDGNGVYAHLDNWVIVAARLGHITEIENIMLLYL